MRRVVLAHDQSVVVLVQPFAYSDRVTVMGKILKKGSANRSLHNKTSSEQHRQTLVWCKQLYALVANCERGH